MHWSQFVPYMSTDIRGHEARSSTSSSPPPPPPPPFVPPSLIGLMVSVDVKAPCLLTGGAAGPESGRRMEGCVGLSTQSYSSAPSGVVASGRQMEGGVGLYTRSYSFA